MNLEISRAGSADAFEFIKPARALYATSPMWNPQAAEPPFKLTEHAEFVLGTQAYRPIPFPLFMQSLVALSDLGAIEICPSDLFERYETSSLLDGRADFGGRCILWQDVYMRLRRDRPMYRDPADVVHGLIIVGVPRSIERFADQIGFPHPFDDTRYPYKELFYDSRKDQLPVLL